MNQRKFIAMVLGVVAGSALLAFGGYKLSNNKKVMGIVYAQKKPLEYDPPQPAGIDGRFLFAGTIESVGKGSVSGYAAETYIGHLQPDFTEVELADKRSVRFCGNLLDKFAPGTKIWLVIPETNVSNYNGCFEYNPAK